MSYHYNVNKLFSYCFNINKPFQSPSVTDINGTALIVSLGMAVLSGYTRPPEVTDTSSTSKHASQLQTLSAKNLTSLQCGPTRSLMKSIKEAKEKKTPGYMETIHRGGVPGGISLGTVAYVILRLTEMAKPCL